MVNNFFLLETAERVKQFDSVGDQSNLLDIERMSDVKVNEDACAGQCLAFKAKRRDLLLSNSLDRVTNFSRLEAVG